MFKQRVRRARQIMKEKMARSCYYYLPGQISEMSICNLLKPHLHLLLGDFAVVFVLVAVAAVAKELDCVEL